jgi:hypothetical protein
MNQYKNQSFFKLAIRFAIVFLLIVSFIEIVFSSVKNLSFTGMFTELFSDGKWFFFVKRLSVMSAFYGLFMAGYYKFIKK